MRFEYYVINYNFNKQATEQFNIFNNINVQERVEKEIKRFLNNPEEYRHTQTKYNMEKRCSEVAEEYVGFNALCREIQTAIQWQEWGRCEYEICAGQKFTREAYEILKEAEKYRADGKTLSDFIVYLERESKINAKLNAWDCYAQAEPNVQIITLACLTQYVTQMKTGKRKLEALDVIAQVMKEVTGVEKKKKKTASAQK